jgi:prefoldin beta subunit
MSKKFESILLQELDLLKGDDSVFKLVGPVLLKQDLVEAQQTVAKRIEYINGEM